ncbi:MAG: hypothetical protein LBI04_08310 [Treponema sp.]|jgi:hypothetical protein|nr:hypothetical protein [Treponema sp.]
MKLKYLSILAAALLLSVCSTSQKIKDEPFTVDLNSPKIPAGTLEIQFEKLMNIGDLRQVDVTIEYYPVEDAVCLQFRLDFMTYYQFWSRDGRAAYMSALEQYKEDYAARTLSSKTSKKTKRQYGKIDGYVIWQAFAYSVRAKANTDIELGYYMRDVSQNRASFFTLFQREAVFIDEMSKKEKRETTNITMYLTRSKADDLAEFFDQDFLRSLSGSQFDDYGVTPGLDEY